MIRETVDRLKAIRKLYNQYWWEQYSWSNVELGYYTDAAGYSDLEIRTFMKDRPLRDRWAP